jgi:hypothetical protein
MLSCWGDVIFSVNSLKSKSWGVYCDGDLSELMETWDTGGIEAGEASCWRSLRKGGDRDGIIKSECWILIEEERRELFCERLPKSSN